MTASGGLSSILMIILSLIIIAAPIVITYILAKRLIAFNAEAKAKSFAKYFKESTPARGQNTKTRTEDTDYEAWRAEKLRKEAENSAE